LPIQFAYREQFEKVNGNSEERDFIFEYLEQLNNVDLLSAINGLFETKIKEYSYKYSEDVIESIFHLSHSKNNLDKDIPMPSNTK